ncbi:MAG TPA: 5-formyltetrahydrofolate cyclo-ligase [Flavisolibacter sp.]|jgi:5-formyltetrahydrofolate cyclo-ligase|nr:5-formyltetrahydrofolate cyclo-ligase [Flavisolibacter sp.]
MLKKEARNLFRKKRQSLTPGEKLKWDDLLLIQFQTIELPFIDLLLSFYPIEEKQEVNTFLITDYLHFRNPGLQICYPRTLSREGAMQAVVCHADTGFELNEWGIPEPIGAEIAAPDQLQLVLVPMLGFDTTGHRIGYGKGYYDRYLMNCSEACLKIGLCYYEPIAELEDSDEFDVPLDFCITPQRTYVF